MWHSLAVALRVPQEQLEGIEGHCQSDFDSLVEICDAWLNMLKDENTSPTWQAVISALHEAGAKEYAEELNKGEAQFFELVIIHWVNLLDCEDNALTEKEQLITDT